MSLEYPSIFIREFRHYNGSPSKMSLASNSIPYSDGTGYDTITPVASSYEVATVISGLRAELYTLQNQIRNLEAQLRRDTHPKPLDRTQIEGVMDEAYKNQTANAGVAGQQVTIWDGIEPHVVRATEKAHGIG